jgi:hypothetical protein
MGMVIPSPCRQAALLGPCFKTGPCPSPTLGGIGEPSAGRCLPGSPVGWPPRGSFPLPDHRRPPASGPPLPAPPWRLGHRTHGALLRGGRHPLEPPAYHPSAALRRPPPRSAPKRGELAGVGRGLTPSSSRTASLPRPRAYSGPVAELGARLHRAGLDGLLALLPECFAQFPQGTYVLSGYWVEI